MTRGGEAAVLAAGAEIVGQVVKPAGFVFLPGVHASGSGGPFADARFVKGDQFIEMHFRRSLGLVSYGWGDGVLSHTDYLRGIGTGGSYPGFSDDPLDGFRHLADDLAGPLAGFVAGDRLSYDSALAVAASTPARRLP